MKTQILQLKRIGIAALCCANFILSANAQTTTVKVHYGAEGAGGGGGTYSFPAIPGTYTIKAEAWGGGGGGGNAIQSNNNRTTAGGGGGGGYATATFTTINSALSITVGAGGGYSPNESGTGLIGGNSRVNYNNSNYIQANGGSGGAGAFNVQGMPGGIGGMAISTGFPNLGTSGANGNRGSVNSETSGGIMYGGTGGNAGKNADGYGGNGGAGKRRDNNTFHIPEALPGEFPGGGGGGDAAYSNQMSGNGGSGGNGEVIISFSYTAIDIPNIQSSVSESAPGSGIVYIPGGGSTMLSVTNPISGGTYDWYKDGLLIYSGNSYYEVTTSGNYYVCLKNIIFAGARLLEFVSNGDGASISGNTLVIGGNSCSRTIEVIVLPEETGISVWSPNWAGDTGMTDDDLTNWNDARNWVRGIFPINTSRVYIPGYRATAGVTGVPIQYFPYLTEGNSYNCEEIYLASGAEIGNPQLLHYDIAHVQYNLGLGATSQSQISNVELLSIIENGPKADYDHLKVSAALAGENVFARGQWHTLTAPLHGMVSGDYSFGELPRAFIRKFDANEVETGSAFKGNWTNTYSSNIEPLRPAEGYAVWINAYQDQDGYRETAAGLNEAAMGVGGRTVGLSQINGILEFPYHNEDYVLQFDAQQRAHRIHQATGGDASKFYRYWSDLSLVFQDETVARSNPDRFAFEGLSTYTITAGSQSSIALIGNPYPSTIDFDQFYAANSGKIKNGYTLWTGSSYSSYLLGVGGYGSTVGAVDKYIAPGQSFLVELAEGITTADLSFPASITVRRTPSLTSMLRSGTIVQGILNIEAENAAGKTITGVVQHEEGSTVIGNYDMSKILPSFNASPEIYTLKTLQSGGIRGVAANFIPHNAEMLIPVGIATTAAGKLSFTLRGMNGFDGQVLFIDKQTQSESDISGLQEYVYNCDYTPVRNAKNEVLASEDRFFLRVSPASTTPISESQNDASLVGINSTESGLRFYAGSTIRSISLYDINGRLVAEKTGINSSVYFLPCEGNLFVARVVTDQGTAHLKAVKK
ncbi:MAG: hypothetical protein LBR81_04470 [Prevotellaceae bacterium]|jgi:hypothetical protein|nr:hypothetical protein [Prevotellaceae bacterium]